MVRRRSSNQPAAYSQLNTRMAEAPTFVWYLLRCIRPKEALKTILAIDGGGLRGLIAGVVLQYVEQCIMTYLVNNSDELGKELNICRVTSTDGHVTVEECDRVDMRELGVESGEAQLRKLEFLQWLKQCIAEARRTEPKPAGRGIDPEACQDAPLNLKLRVNIWLADYFDLCAGTSTGAIIATYLATRGKYSMQLVQDMVSKTPEGYNPPCPGSASAIVDVFKAKATEIFPHKFFKWRRLFRALYSPKPLEDILAKAFDNATLDDGIEGNTSLLVPAFDLYRSRPISFYSRQPEGTGDRETGYAALAVDDQEAALLRATTSSQPEHRRLAFAHDVDNEHHSVHKSDFVFLEEHKIYLRQVVRASVAAPTFLPAAKLTLQAKDGSQFQRKLKCIDGGVAANNPSQEALTFARIKGSSIKDIAMLSLGTGVARKPTNVGSRAGGVGWLTDGNLVNLLMTGNAATVAAQQDFITNQRGVKLEKKNGGSHHLRIDKIVFDPGRQGAPNIRRMAKALSGLDLTDFMTDYETIANDLLLEANDFLPSEKGRTPDKPTNGRMINKFVTGRIFRYRHWSKKVAPQA